MSKAEECWERKVEVTIQGGREFVDEMAMRCKCDIEHMPNSQVQWKAEARPAKRRVEGMTPGRELVEALKYKETLESLLKAERNAAEGFIQEREEAQEELRMTREAHEKLKEETRAAIPSRPKPVEETPPHGVVTRAGLQLEVKRLVARVEEKRLECDSLQKDLRRCQESRDFHCKVSGDRLYTLRDIQKILNSGRAQEWLDAWPGTC